MKPVFLGMRTTQRMVVWQVQVSLPTTKQEIRPLDVTLELGFGQRTQTDCLSELSVSWFRSCTEEWVNTILPSQSLCGGSGKQCRLNWPASSVYPRGPKFTYETAEHSCICSARTHRYTHWSRSDASNGVHSSMESNNTERLLPMYTSRKDKCASRHVVAHTQTQTCIQIWGCSCVVHKAHVHAD